MTPQSHAGRREDSPKATCAGPDLGRKNIYTDVVPSGGRIQIKGSNQDAAPVKFFARLRIEEQTRVSSAPPRG